MAINFPNSPSDGQQLTEGSVTYTYNATKGYWESTESSSSSSSSTTVVADMSALIAITGMSDGDQALVQATNKLYMYSGTGWYLIATIQNNAPSAITGVGGTYQLAIDGTVTTITAVATDPEGFPLTWSYSTSGLGSIATVSNTDNVFTITPSTTEADAGTFSLTINATDGVNGAVSTSTNLTLNFIVTVTDSKYTTLLATAVDTSDNSNITDSSTNNHTITVTGDAHAGTFSPFRSGGYSTYFDGSSDNLSLTANSGFSLDGNFTIECWFNPSSITLDSQHPSILKVGTTQIYLNSSNNYVGFYYDTYDVVKSANSSITENQWYHVSVTRSGSLLTLFLNGVSVDTVSSSTATFGGSSGTVYIGTFSGTGGDYHGYIRDLRIVKGTAITPPSGGPTELLESVTNTSLLTCHLPYISDGSTNDHSITINGDVSTKPFSPYDYLEYSSTDHGGSVYFDGSGDSLTINSPPTLGANDYTVESWIYFVSSSSGYSRFLSQGPNTTNPLRRVSAFNLLTNGSFNMQTYDGSNRVLHTTSNGNFKLNNWHHVAITHEYNGSTGGTYKFWVDGELIPSGTKTYSNSYFWNYNGIGDYDMGINEYRYNGAIDDAEIYYSDYRISNTVRYTSSFTPPTAPLSSTGATLHLKGTAASIIDKSQGSNLKLVGNTTGSTTQVKFIGSKSMYFDGIDDHIEGPTVSDLNIGTGDFTIECWIYETTTNTNKGIWDGRLDGTSTDGFTFTRIGVDTFRVWSGSALITTGSFTIQNTWNHCALVRNSGTLTIYINGTSSGTPVSNSTNFSNSGKLIIGAGRHSSGSNATAFITGYIQDLRVSNYARYTANFTPPTASLEG